MAWKPDYITDEQLADYVRASSSDPYVAGNATAACRAVEGACHRQFGQLEVAAVRTYECGQAFRRRDGWWLLPIDDLQLTAGATVTVAGAAVAAGATGYRLWPRNAAADGVPYTGLLLYDRPTGDVDMLARWGWTSVPAAVPTACLMQGNRWHIRRESPYGIAGSVTEGSQVSLTARLDPDVRGILAAAGLIRMELPR